MAEFVSAFNCKMFSCDLPDIPVRWPGRCLRGRATSVRSAAPACGDVCRPCAGATGLLDEYACKCYSLTYLYISLSACIPDCGPIVRLFYYGTALGPGIQIGNPSRVTVCRTAGAIRLRFAEHHRSASARASKKHYWVKPPVAN